jgi:SAM-dependent methyltransferase
MAASAHYQGAAGATYHRSQQRISPSLRAELAYEKIRPHLTPVVTSAVDFGCGDGALLAQLRGVPRRVGVDAIAENRRAAAERGVEVHESLGDIPDESADVVISHHALEHTLDPLGTLREIRRVLHPGGRLVLYVPADDWRVQRDYRPSDRNHHLFTWTPLSLGHLLAEAGLVPLLVRVEHRALPGRATESLAQLPGFSWVMMATSWVLRRHEILAVATRTRTETPL